MYYFGTDTDLRTDLVLPIYASEQLTVMQCSWWLTTFVLFRFLKNFITVFKYSPMGKLC